jgi:hypothetical protein
MIKSSKSKATSAVDQQATKKSRKDTSRIDSPDVKDYISAWTETKETDAELATANSVFGTRNAWFVRAQYIPLYEEILSDDSASKEIIQGSAGIGKSSFLLYALTRLRLT